MDLPRTLLVTNDFPPRVGGIQRTLEALWRHLPAQSLAVMAPSGAGAAEFDEGTPYPVIRSEREFMWPTPDFVGGLRRIVDERAIEVVLFGAVAPLSVVGPQLARSGTPYLVAAHGFDHWLATTPGTHALTRYATSRAARVPVMCSEFVARTVRTAVPAHVPVSVLYPGADLEVFRPDLDADDLRERHGLGDRPVVVCVSRLVRRKGQDVLIRAMGLIRQRVPDAVLLIVGGGPDEARLHGLAAALAPKGSVVFAGQVSEEELPRYYAVGDVFAMPCRTRLAGFELEGWGNVFIEAAACGKPVVVGDSGGAGESLVHGETGLLVNGRNVRQVAASVGDLLADPGWASELGKEGRARVERCHSWTTIAERLATWIHQASG